MGILAISAHRFQLYGRSSALVASMDFDLVVLGAAREPIFRQVLFGEIPEKVARYSPASVLVVKQYEGHVRSMFKRIFG